MQGIVVTGIGIISSIGNNLDETYASLIEKRSGIGKIEILDSLHKDEFLLGEVKLSHSQLVELAEVDPANAWTRTDLLGIIAAKQAISDSGISVDDCSLVSASTVGGMDRSELYYKDFLGKAEHKQYIDSHHAGNSTEKIAEQTGIKGLLTTISTACSSSLNSIIFGSKLIKSGKAKTVLVGGTDALSKFTLNGFNTLMILDRELCRPFDENRQGLNLGEAAAYLVLEKKSEAIKTGKKIYARVGGYANANDAHHQTASSGDGKGPYLAMKNAIESAGIKTDEISYINVHGTGTHNNDLTESTALKRLFGENIPPFSSTKAYTGHTLGAAGVVESVISILALNNSVAFPNINFQNPIKETALVPVTQIKQLAKASHVLTNSFGFGGNDSSIVFTAPDKNEVVGETKKINAVYINGSGCVSPQNTLNNNYLHDGVLEYDQNFLQILKPNYREFIDVKSLRRMSKIVRMGMVSSITALKEAGIEKPDAIITATGMGCQKDTETFLNSMIDDQEGLLAPTSFIRSTHNTVGGSIALMQQNHSYNLTYVHRTFSFESALLDSILLLNNDEAKNVLLGGFDEITEESWLIKTKIDFYKEKQISNLKLLDYDQKGALAGEGSSFFILSGERSEHSYAKISGTKMFFRPQDIDEIKKNIISFIEGHSLKTEDVDLVILGFNGDREFDDIYDKLETELFSSNNTAYYKHLCGEYDTSAAFATWLAAGILKENEIPKSVARQRINKNTINNILIYNQFRNINHSLILLKKA
jgi:3-oxoacyl-(acyl-carrier-protein) synthase